MPVVIRTRRQLAHVGHGGKLEAVVETSHDPEFPLINYNVRFRLTNRYGESLDLGRSLITGEHHTDAVFDENGARFPDLSAAVRAHAAPLLRVAPME